MSLYDRIERMIKTIFLGQVISTFPRYFFKETSRDRIHHYHQVLTPEEIQWLEQEGMDVFQNFGYHLTHSTQIYPLLF